MSTRAPAFLFAEIILGKENLLLPWNKIRILVFNTIACMVGSVYFLFLVLNGTSYRWISIYAFITTCILGLTNRFGRSEFARAAWISNALLITTLYHATLANVSFAAHYITLSILSIILFSHESKIKAILLPLLSLTLFFGVTCYLSLHYTAAEIFKTVKFVDLIVNFSVCFAISTLSIYIYISEERIFSSLIAQEKQHSSALKDKLSIQERKYSLIANAAGAMLMEYRISENILVLDDTLLRFGFFNSNSPLMNEFMEIVHPDDRRLLSHFLSTRQHRDTAPERIEFRIRNRNGKFRWVSANSVTIYSIDGTTLLISLVDVHHSRLIRDRLSAKNKMLAKANAELDNFVYHTSHDIRSPICTIIGLTHLGTKTNDIKELRTYLQMINERAKALDRFVHNIMNYANNSRDELQMEYVDLAELVNQITTSQLEQLEFSADEITISVSDTADIKLVTDRNRLFIVLFQLIGNAIVFRDIHKTPTVISISVQEVLQKHIIKVEDNGIGIDSNYLPKVFDMFYRAAENAKGSGLGLYIAKEVISKLDGEIYIESELGRGTIVTIELPNRSTHFAPFVNYTGQAEKPVYVNVPSSI